MQLMNWLGVSYKACFLLEFEDMIGLEFGLDLEFLGEFWLNVGLLLFGLGHWIRG